MPTVVGMIESSGATEIVDEVIGFTPDFAIFISVLLDTNGLNVGDHTCMSIGMRKSSGTGLHGISWFQKFGPGTGGTGLFDITGGAAALLRDDNAGAFVGGTVWNWLPNGFEWNWFAPRAGLKVYYIACKGFDLRQSVMVGNGLNTIDTGVRASVALSLVNEFYNNYTTIWPFGGFILGDGTVEAGGYSEYSTEGEPLGSQQHAFMFPGVTTSQIIPVYDAGLLGSLTGDWVDALGDDDGYSLTFRTFTKESNNWAVRDMIRPDSMRFRNKLTGPESNYSWGDGYRPRAVLTCCPGPHGQGFGFSPLAGTGFGIHGLMADGTQMDIHLGIGRQDDGTPYSWRYEDRSYIAAFDRATPDPTDYGLVVPVPGEIQWDRTADDGGGPMGFMTFDVGVARPQIYRRL